MIRPRLPRPAAPPRAERLGGAVVAVVLAAAFLLEATSAPQGGGITPTTVALAAWIAGCVLVALVLPVTGLVLCQAAVAVPLFVLAGGGAGGALLIAILVLVAYAAYRRPVRPALAGYVVASAVPAALIVLHGDSPWEFVFWALILGVGLLVGVLLRREQARSTQLARLAAELAAEREHRARAAVDEERARISRELHDAVAHSVSVMTLQVGVVRRRLAGRPDAAAEHEALAAAEGLGRQSVDELRRIVGLVRRDDGDGLAPRPGLARLDALVEGLGRAGLPVTVRIEGEPAELPAALDMSAYRVVQEALTNTLRHAGPGATATVTVRWSAADVTVEVVDDGAGGTAEAADTEPGAPGGHGLLGMRERTALFGGRLEAGPRPEGGFAVRAVLPRTARATAAVGA